MSVFITLNRPVYALAVVTSLLACNADPAQSKHDSADDEVVADDDSSARGDRDSLDASTTGRGSDASVRPMDAGHEPALPDKPKPDASASDASSAPDAGARDGSSSDASPSDARVPDQPAKNYDWHAGDYPPDLHAQTYLELKDLPGQGGRTRGYKVHVPRGYSAEKPTPVLYSFHGIQQNAVSFTVDGTSLVAESDAQGFVLVIPNGVQEEIFGGAWNAGTCCGTPATERLDDVGFVRAIHAAISEHLNIDPRRVYATGLSNGAYMTHRLGCEAADLFAAIAPLAGSIGTSELSFAGTNREDPDLKSCNPVRPISVLAMHGTSDGLVPYKGMKPSLDLWAKAAGCGASTMAASQPESGGDTTCVTYRDCPDGIEVTGCTVDNGGHCWFGDPTCGIGIPVIGSLVVGNNSNFLDASKAAWGFVSRFQR